MKKRGGRGGENRTAKHLRKTWQQRKREPAADAKSDESEESLMWD